MILTLKSFSQDVDLADPTQVQYFLVFDGEGKNLRLPVPKETTEELAKFLYAEGAKEEKEEYESPAFTYETKLKTAESQEETDGAEEFGGDFQEEEDEEQEEEYTDDLPNNEEEVPSL